MQRLTKKIEKDYYGNDVYGAVYDGSAAVGLIKANQKLGPIEDLEERIGMPLDVLFNLMGKGIYIIDKADISYLPFTINAFYKDNDIFYLSYVNGYGLDMSVKPDDCNKTWFLTREEAEQVLEVRSKRVEPCG